MTDPRRPEENPLDATLADPSLEPDATVQMAPETSEPQSDLTVEQVAPLPGQTVAGDGRGGPVDIVVDQSATVAFRTEGAVRADPSVTVPGYTIVGELGRGGMGVVYKARQLGLNRWVALKMILAGAHAGPQQLARFKIEAEAVGHLQHPNIVQVYEIGDHDGLPFFSLEFVGGPCLSSKIHRQPQPPRDAAHLTETLARAMYYAHQQGVIHRDLKPANVLLTEDAIPKITDFGLAKRLESDSSQTKSGTLMGTPSYMAPEQARGETHQIGPLADVYSLGAMLYELLTGRPPFLGESIIQTIRQVTNDEPLPPTRLQPKVPRDLETICLKCLQKDKPKRYQSALELAEDLRCFLSDEPIKARPVSALERGARWCRRNPWVAGLTAAVALLLLLVSAGSIISAYRISLEKAEADRQKELAVQHAEAERQAHERALRQATANLGTIYDVVTKADEMLGTKAGTAPLRQKLLEMVMDRLKEVNQEELGSTADRTMGVALQHMGLLFNRAGKTEQEIDAYKRSLEIFERLIREKPEEVDWNRYDAAVSYNNLGEIGRENEPDPARAFEPYEKSCALYRDLVLHPNQDKPAMFKREHGLTSCYVKLAMLSLVVGDPARARDYAAEAVKHADAIAIQYPNQAGHQEVLAGAYFALGKANARVPDENEARKSYDHSMEFRQELINADATNAYASQEMARTVEAVGDLEMELHNLSKALGHYRKAHEMFEELSKKERDNPELLWYLSNADYSLAIALEAQGDKEAALKLRQSCAKTREALLKEDPKNPQRKIEVMLIRARLGQVPEATELAADISKLAPHHPGMLFSVACCYGLCKQAETSPQKRKDYAEKAVAALRAIMKQGYRDLCGLERDPDLAPLRGESAYRDALTQLTKK